MISRIRILNFKSLSRIDTHMKPLTLLAGVNSSGKSSLIHALRLATDPDRQNAMLGYGTERDLYTRGSSPDQTKITINEHSYSIFKEQTEENQTIPVKIYYISADRIGPRPFLATSNFEDGLPHVGEKGEYTAAVLTRNAQLIIPEELLHSSISNSSLTEQVHEWIQDISPGSQVHFNEIREQDISYIKFNDFRATNVGFGLSHSLPVITAALSLPENAILAVENPEAHLHPAGQTAMGRLLAKAATTGKQIIVETHSDHLLDGIRIAIRDGELNHNDAVFLFFKLGESGNTEIEKITSDEHGKIDRWPMGFFDQTMKNRGRLSGRPS